MSEIPYDSESYRKRNPQLFGSMGAVGNPNRQSGRKSQNRGMGEMQGRVGFRVTLISLRTRLADAHDNIRTGAKPLIDRITEWLGFKSDSDPRLEWCYEQFRTTGRTGTIVHIERKRL